MNTNDIETQRTIYLRNLEDLQERIIALSKTIKDPSMTPDMKKATIQIDDIIEKLQELKEIDVPYNYSIPVSLLKWLDKPADNNPDIYYNIYLSLCEEINQIHKARDVLRSHVASRLEEGLASLLNS